MEIKISSLASLITCLLLTSAICQSDEDLQMQKKLKVYKEQHDSKDAVGLTYGQNTEIITFNVVYMTDFIVKTTDDEEVKGHVYTYWKQDNAYVASEYREGEHIRLLIYEGNHRVLYDYNFYTTYGFKFKSEKDKVYTIRLVQNGKISKLVSMELSKATLSTENRASKDHIDSFSQRMENLAGEINVLAQISDFALAMHERGAKAMNHSVCIYMTYLLVEAGAILLIVALQVKVLIKMLGSSSIV